MSPVLIPSGLCSNATKRRPGLLTDSGKAPPPLPVPAPCRPLPWGTPPFPQPLQGTVRASPDADGCPLLASRTQPPQPPQPRRQSVTLCDPCSHTAGWERPEARAISQATQGPPWKISLAPWQLEWLSPPRGVRGPKDKSPPGMPQTQDAGAALGSRDTGLIWPDPRAISLMHPPPMRVHTDTDTRVLTGALRGTPK